MKIYISHSKNSNFLEELYKPLRESDLASKHEFIFPHSDSTFINSKDIFSSRGCDMVIAEVSTPATGVGIELGWANAFNVPIICVHKTGSKISGSLSVVAKEILEYSDSADLIAKLLALDTND